MFHVRWFLAFLLFFGLESCTLFKHAPTPVPSPSPTTSASVSPLPGPSGIPTIPFGKKSTVYFGRLIKFQGAKDVASAVSKMSAYDLVIFPGDAVLTGSAGWQHQDAIDIIKGLKGHTLVAGYVPLGTAEGSGNVGEDGKNHKRITRDEFAHQAATWKAMGADLGFADMFGDQDVYQVSEADQVFAINTFHALGMPIIMNNWNVSEIYRPGKDLPLWPARDMTMFEDMGSDPVRDAKKWNDFQFKNSKTLLVVGVAFEQFKNAKTDSLGKELNYFGYAPANYGSN